MKLSEIAATKVQSVIAFKVESVEAHPKREGYYKVSGSLENGDETFIIANDTEWEQLPAKEDIVNLAGFATLKKNKIGKYYVERVNSLPDLNKGTAFNNPFNNK